jgi:hypothetical protein
VHRGGPVGWAGGEVTEVPGTELRRDGWADIVSRVDTKFLKHELRGMKRNVTVVMDEDTARWVRVEAARRDLSVSAYLGQVVKQEREKAEGYALAMERFLNREPRPLGPPNVPLPSRDELHERR